MEVGPADLKGKLFSSSVVIEEFRMVGISSRRHYDIKLDLRKSYSRYMSYVPFIINYVGYSKIAGAFIPAHIV